MQALNACFLFRIAVNLTSSRLETIKNELLHLRFRAVAEREHIYVYKTNNLIDPKNSLDIGG